MGQLLLFSHANQKRFDAYLERRESPLETSDIGFIYSTLAQCFLPYRDPGVNHWERHNGKYSLLLSAGAIHDPSNPDKLLELGLPYGPKPRIFMCYINSLAVKRKSSVVPIPRTMSALLKELGLGRRGGPRGSIGVFKDQLMRLAGCAFTIVGPGPKGGETYTKAPPIKAFTVWLPPNHKSTVWPTEIVLTDDFFQSLQSHAIPYDIRALRSVQSNARALDIFLWCTQRLPRLNKPLMMTWDDLFDLFGGGIAKSNQRLFRQKFRADLLAARMAYPAARMEEVKEGYLLQPSPTSVPRLRAKMR